MLAALAACGGDSDGSQGDVEAGGQNASGGGSGPAGGNPNATGGGQSEATTTETAATTPPQTPSRTAAPQANYPVEFTPPAEAHTVTSANPCGTPVSLAMLAGRVDTAIPSDPEVLTSRRGTPEDKYVYITYRAIGVSGQCGGANIADRIVRLEIDGLPKVGGNSSNYVVRNGEGRDFTVVYVVPPGTEKFRVLLGEAGQTVAEIDLDVPTFEK
jgi:hypothetical protein